MGNQHNTMTTLTLIFAILHGTHGLIAYDCTDAKTNATVISLRDIQPCAPPEMTYVSETVSVQVIQRNEFSTQKVWSCNVEVTRLIFHCGMHSHTSIVSDGQDTYIEKLGAEGLYTQQEIKKAQRMLTFGTERKAVENILIRRTAGLPATDQGYRVTSMFSEKELKELAHSTISHIWGWLSELGSFVSGLIGFYVVYKTLHYLCGVIINSLRIYQTIGCGVAIFAGIWSSLTSWVLHKNDLKKKSKEEIELTKHDEENPQETHGQASSTAHWTDSRDSINSP